VRVLNDAARMTIPVESSNYCKFWWNQEIQELKNLSCSSHRNWLNAGRPGNGTIYEEKRKAKAAYKLCIKQQQKMEKEGISDSLHDSLLKKSGNNFWKTWKIKFGKCKSNISLKTFDNCKEDNDVTNKFADYFEQACSPNSRMKNSEKLQLFLTRLSDYAGDQVSSQPPVDVEMLDSIISKLHLGKASGIDKLSAEHLRYSHPIVTSILVKLFNLD